MTTTIYFDVETASADQLWTWQGPGYVRLCGWKYDGDDTVHISTDATELVDVLNRADTIIGHNVFGFDLLALAHHHGLSWDELESKVIDTELLARLADPPQAKEHGVDAERRYDLDRVALKLGVAGKSHDLKALAKVYGGYDQIPVDDTDYVDYLRADVTATEAIFKRLPVTAYARREMKLASRLSYATLTGFRVDEALTDQRVAEGVERRRKGIELLRDKYGLITTDDKDRPYKAPIATKAGKASLEKAFLSRGIDSYPRTPKTGALSTNRDDMTAMIEHYADMPEIVELCDTIMTVTTIRTVYDTAKKYTVDGRVHPGMSLRQATGRVSMTKPGLTVIGKRGGKVVEREIYLPEPGHVILCFDLDQVDARAIAAHSQDQAYMANFAPGRDLHSEVSKAVFGTVARRDDAKAIGHAWNYGVSVNRLIQTGVEEKTARHFDRQMTRNYPQLVRWREVMRQRAARGELLDNGFGRFMRPDPDRAYTQAPALIGQGTARDLMAEGINRLPRYIARMLKAFVHDEIVLSVPEDQIHQVTQDTLKALTFTWRRVPITAGASKPGKNWAAAYTGD